MAKHKTTKAHYQLFKEEFMRWYHRFGLQRYQVYFSHEECYGLAYCSTGGIEGRTDMNVTIGFNKVWEGVKPICREIKSTAFHECMELLLAHMSMLASNRFITKDEIGEEKHRLIRTLEAAVFHKGKSEGTESSNG